MENYDYSVHADSSDVNSTAGDGSDFELYDDEDESYSVSSGDESSENGDNADNDNDDGDYNDNDDGDDNDNDDGDAEDDRYGKKNVADQGNVDLESVSASANDSLSQIEKKKKRKTSCNDKKSVQQKCSNPPKYHGDDVITTNHMDAPSTSRQFHPMYGLQPLMPMVHPGLQPMHVQPVYPMHGMSVGENSNSCVGLLQKVMKSAGQD